MSGGSLNYVYLYANDPSSILGKLDDLRKAEDYLRSNNKFEAANRVLAYLKELEIYQDRIMSEGERISGLLKATEWAGSYDTGLDEIDIAYQAIIELQSTDS